MFKDSSTRQSPLSNAMPPPLGRGLYVELHRNAVDRWLPRLTIAIGAGMVLVIVGSLIVGFMN